jgi:Glycosyl hydrolases family 25
MRRIIFAALVAALLACAGCGSKHTITVIRTPALAHGEPTCVVPLGEGHPGICNPQKEALRVAPLPATTSVGGLQGADVSNNNGLVDFHQIRVEAGIKFVYAKADEACILDSAYRHNIAEALRTDTYFSAYDYFRPGRPVISDALCFARQIKLAIAAHVKLLPPAYDVETFNEGPVCAKLAAAVTVVRHEIPGLELARYGSTGNSPNCGSLGLRPWPADWLVSNPDTIPGMSSHYLLWQYFGPRFASSHIAGMDRDKGAPDLLRHVFEPPKPVSTHNLRIRRRVLRRYLVNYGCRRRARIGSNRNPLTSTHVGPICKSWFRQGRNVNQLLRERGAH